MYQKQPEQIIFRSPLHLLWPLLCSVQLAYSADAMCADLKPFVHFESESVRAVIMELCLSETMNFIGALWINIAV